MHTGYIIRDQDRPHFITCTVVNWVDVFTRKAYRDIVIDSLPSGWRPRQPHTNMDYKNRQGIQLKKYTAMLPTPCYGVGGRFRAS
jgi:hypothetical protein